MRALVAERRNRHRRATLAVLGALAIAPMLAMLGRLPAPVLVWNVSASAPRGLYLVRAGEQPSAGDFAVAWLPRGVRELAAKRGYLPANVPLVKRVAAVGGDLVCASGAHLIVNRREAAVRRPFDARGRSLPSWLGCRRLGAGELLLLNESPWSFDGRYFGPSERSDLIGRAWLLWRA